MLIREQVERALLLLELQREGLTLLKWRAVALPSCPDNIFAEGGCQLILQQTFCVKKWYTEATQLTRPYLQGDILPIVKHLAFAGRFRRNRPTAYYTAYFR